MTDSTSSSLPEGHPLSWDDLVPYEKDQGGYWLYPPGCDVHGNGKVWVRVPRPEHADEMTGFTNRLHRLHQDAETRAADRGYPELASLAAELGQITARLDTDRTRKT
ncbi:hypothetical protein [Streptomyces longwoodensis]|uniref:hypothetical protein n=1 Tax=Streptomyces longwoodensis TaxID=68231 RepID=UPI0022542FE7|nr:hypothetical protein [Streptomyces longwoodensis]MCX5000897.1 hypothetical protein [Streptomyces longwoodensis]